MQKRTGRPTIRSTSSTSRTEIHASLRSPACAHRCAAEPRCVKFRQDGCTHDPTFVRARRCWWTTSSGRKPSIGVNRCPRTSNAASAARRLLHSFACAHRGVESVSLCQTRCAHEPQERLCARKRQRTRPVPASRDCPRRSDQFGLTRQSRSGGRRITATAAGVFRRPTPFPHAHCGECLPPAGLIPPEVRTPDILKGMSLSVRMGVAGQNALVRFMSGLSGGIARSTRGRPKSQCSQGIAASRRPGQ